MTDHLEPYRRIARSIRFFPPVSLNQPSQQSVAQPVAPVSVDLSSKKTIPDTDESATSKPAIDPSEHVAALVHEAVQKPTVLPVTYTILENIGDRISRLTTPKRTEPIILQPKIPQPDPNWAPTHTIESQPINVEAKKQIDGTHQATSTPGTVVTELPPVEDTHGNDSVAVVVESITAEEPSQELTSATVTPEPVTAEEPPQELTSTTATPEPVETEETPTDDTLAVVAEPVEVQQTADGTSDNNTPTEVATEPTAIRETTVESSISDTESPAAEAQANQAPTLLERVSSVIEAVATVFTNSDADNKDLEAVVEQPSVSDSTEKAEGREQRGEALLPMPSGSSDIQQAEGKHEAEGTSLLTTERKQGSESPSDLSSLASSTATDVPAANTVEASTVDASPVEAPTEQEPSLLERVSSVVGAVATAFQHPDIQQKDAETEVEEPSSSGPSATVDKPKDANPDVKVDAANVQGSDSPLPSNTISKSSKSRSQKKTKSKGFGDSKKTR